MTANDIRLPASSADQWGIADGCRGWAVVKRDNPHRERDTTAAIEGLAAHDLAEYATRWTTTPHPSEYVGKRGERPIEYDHEMFECAVRWRQVLESVDPGLQNTTVEEPLHAESLGSKAVTIAKADAWALKPGELHIFDYKYGRNPVEPGTLQLTCGLVAIIDAIRKRTGARTVPNRLYKHIFQPRKGGHKVVEITLDVFMAEVAQLQRAHDTAADMAAGTVPAKCKTGNHCFGCSNIGFCKAGNEVVDRAMNLVTGAEAAAYDGMSLGSRIKFLEDLTTMVKRQLEPLHGMAMGMIQNGEPVNGYGIGEGDGSTVWNVETEILKQIAKTTGVNLISEKPCTPKQAIGKGLAPWLVDGYSERKPGAAKLERINFNKVKEIFS